MLQRQSSSADERKGYSYPLHHSKDQYRDVERHHYKEIKNAVLE